MHGKDFLPVQLEFAAKTAAHIGSYDTQTVLWHTGDQRQQHAQDVGNLSRGPHCHLVTHAHGGRDDGARLHVASDDALIDEASLHHDIRLGLGLLIGDAGARKREGVALIGAR